MAARGRYGLVGSTTRLLYRMLSPRYGTAREEGVQVPSVYIVHHQNLFGPLTCMAWLPIHVRLWVFDAFASRKACFRQYAGYTLTTRFGMPRTLAVAAALPLSRYVPALMRSLRAIPVHRGGRDVILTLRDSVDALVSGESLLISPDVDYADDSPAMGSMYDGFLNLERSYCRKTGLHLGFVPVYVDKRTRTIRVGRALRFTGQGDFMVERSGMVDSIKAEFARLRSL